MKLNSFTFHPSPILVDSKPLHGVKVGTDGVTDIQLHDGVLVVSKGTQVWFTHTSYGTGVPLPKPPPMPEPFESGIALKGGAGEIRAGRSQRKAKQ